MFAAAAAAACAPGCGAIATSVLTMSAPLLGAAASVVGAVGYGIYSMVERSRVSDDKEKVEFFDIADDVNEDCCETSPSDSTGASDDVLPRGTVRVYIRDSSPREFENLPEANEKASAEYQKHGQQSDFF